MRPVTEEDYKRLATMHTEIETNLSFDDIPESERRIKFPVTRDEAAIAKIYEKVELSRKYLSDIEQMHLNPETWQNDMSLISE